MSTTEFKILGVAGSLRGGSYSTQALSLILRNAEKHGAVVRLLELGKANLPMYGSGQVPEQVSSAVQWADAFVLASPDYHGSMSGALKNFLDHFFEEFAGKLFGYVVASHEKGLTVMDQMRTVVRQCAGWSLPYGVSVNGEQDFSAGSLASAKVDRRIKMTGRDLVVYGRLLKAQFQSDLAGTEAETFVAHYR